jgi:RimJ/RimL family protein N-acetyltransferase
VPCRIHIAEDTDFRLLTEADAERLHELIEANRDYLAAWLPWAAEQSFDDTLEYIRKARVQLEANDGFPVESATGSRPSIGAVAR